ncbi:MAG: hypothetical protein F6K39_35855 [Okeania sp. SIO3B3]|nr:hypothetical protein [Okeania sp. SIO3B3]
MLGTSGVGKTAFMLGMYARMRESINGFTFAASDLDEDLMLSQSWDNLVYKTGQERWPAPNDDTVQRYQFDFNYAFDKLMTFTWLDYRGNALRSFSDAQDTYEIFNALADSTSIFVCVDGGLWADDTPNQTRGEQRDSIRRMNYILTQMYQQTRRKVPIVLVVTKCDKFQNQPPKSDKYDTIFDEIRDELQKKYFSPLFVKNSGWLTMVTFVTLGSDIHEDPDNANIEPNEGVYQPVAFAIYSVFADMARAEEATIEESEADAADREARATKLRDEWFGLGSWFNQGKINDLVTTPDETIDATRLESIQTNLQEIATSLISNSHIYFSGERISADA